MYVIRGRYVWVADDFFGAGVVVAEDGARREGGALDAMDLSAVHLLRSISIVYYFIDMNVMYIRRISM